MPISTTTIATSSNMTPSNVIPSNVTPSHVNVTEADIKTENHTTSESMSHHPTQLSSPTLLTSSRNFWCIGVYRCLGLLRMVVVYETEFSGSSTTIIDYPKTRIVNIFSTLVTFALKCLLNNYSFEYFIF